MCPRCWPAAGTWVEAPAGEDAAWLCDRAGTYLDHHGQPGAALPYLRRGLDLRRAVLGGDHPDTLASRNNLAGAYWSAGRLEEAVGLCEQTLADRVRVLGGDHPDTLSFRNDLAVAYESAGRLKDAVGLCEQTLADRVRVLGGDHPDTLAYRNNLAFAYGSAGRLKEAVGLCEQTLADSVRVLGGDHPSTLASRNNLAGIVVLRITRRISAVGNVVYASSCVLLLVFFDVSVARALGLLTPILLLWPRGDFWKIVPFLGRLLAVWAVLVAGGLYLPGQFFSGVWIGVLCVCLVEFSGWVVGYFRSLRVRRRYPGGMV
jgi:hypothetical protein